MKTLRNSLLLTLLVIIMFGPSAEAQERKGRWNPTARGFAIGAGTGAAAGAVIHKRDRMRGAAVGAVVGAAAGYAVGRTIDKRNQAREAARRAEAYEQQEMASAGRASTMTRSTRTAARSNRAASRDIPATLKPAPDPLASKSPAAAYAFRTGYLLNPDFGDPDAPYGMSEVRQKSW